MSREAPRETRWLLGWKVTERGPGIGSVGEVGGDWEAPRSSPGEARAREREFRREARAQGRRLHHGLG